MDLNKPVKDHVEKNLLHIVLFRYIPYWPLFVLLILISSLVIVTFIHFSPKIYLSTAQILIKDEKKGVDNSKMMESLNMYSSKKIVENEIEVIKSNELIEKIVNKLNLASPVYRREMIVNKPGYLESPLNIVIRDLRIKKEGYYIPFYFDVNDSTVFIEGKSYPLDQWIETNYAVIKFVRNENYIHNLNNEFTFSILNPQTIIDGIKKDLQVNPVSKLGTVISLKYKDQVPKRGEDILNSLIGFYIEASQNEKNTLASNTLKFVEERIKYVEVELDSIERSIQRFKSGNEIVDLGEQSKMYLESVRNFDSKQSELKIQAAVLEQIENHLKDNNAKTGLIPSTLGISDPSLVQLLERLYDLELNYQRLSKTTPDNNLLMLSLKKEIQEIRPFILNNVQNQRKNLATNLSNLNFDKIKYSSVLKTIPEKERELLEINRQQFIKNNVYNFLLQKREETALSYASNISDSSIIDYASTNAIPVWPRKTILWVLGFIIPLIIGVVYVWAKENMTNKILFRSDIEEGSSLKLIGEVMYSRKKEFIKVREEEVIAEQFRQIKASLGLNNMSNQKIILVSSSVSGEGKSFIAANLAVSLSNSNKKVLLVDFDIRRPMLTHYFKSKNNYGITDYIQGGAIISDIIQPTSFSNLYFTSCGLERNQPTDLLLYADLEKVFLNLRKEYDFVIVDSAPIDPVADASIISPFCDKTLFVIRHNKTPKNMLSLIEDYRETNALREISIVFNAVKLRGYLRKSKNYGYGKNYDYLKSSAKFN